MIYKYEKGSKTIRTIPENYCVCLLETFTKGGQTDAALGDLDALGESIVKKLNQKTISMNNLINIITTIICLIGIVFTFWLLGQLHENTVVGIILASWALMGGAVFGLKRFSK